MSKRKRKFNVEEWVSAAKGGDWDAMEPMMWTRGFQIDAVDARGRTALMWVAKAGHTAQSQVIMGKLLDRGADTETRTGKGSRKGSTALTYAAIYHRCAAIRTLLDYGANIHTINDSGESALHESCIGHRARSARVFNGQDCAADVVALLLDHGADVNALCTRNWTPLHHAAQRYANEDTYSVLRLLLDHGANLNARTSRKSTPLCIAMYAHHMNGGRLGSIQYLLRQDGALYDDGKTSLAWVAGRNYDTGGAQESRALEVLEALLNRGANINATGRKNVQRSPLHVAAAKNNADIVAFLLDRGADPNATCCAQHSILVTAVNGDYPRIVRLLLQAGASVPAPTTYIREASVGCRAVFYEVRFRRRLARWQRQFKRQLGVLPGLTMIIFLRAWLMQPNCLAELRAMASILCLPQELWRADHYSDIRIRISMQLSLGECWRPSKAEILEARSRDARELSRRFVQDAQYLLNITAVGGGGGAAVVPVEAMDRILRIGRLKWR